MKILKLAIIFLVIAGGIFLALNWGSLFGQGGRGEEFAENDLIDISEKCDEIRKAWAEQAGWSDELYKLHRDDIDQSKAMGIFSRDGFNTVNNCLREAAINKACDSYMTILQAGNNFSDADLRKAYQGVEAIESYEKLENEPRVERVKDINDLYKKVSRFVSSRHTITSHFDTEKADWVSFYTLQQGIFNLAKRYREDPLFKEMASVPGFQQGLNEDNIKGKTAPQRRAFYQSLSSQIINYFTSVEPTDDKVKLLNQIYKTFTYQESDYGVSELAMLKVSYGKSE